MKFTFWNTNKNQDINEYICKLIEQTASDVLVLAEYKADYKDLIKMLSAKGYSYFYNFKIGCERIDIITKIEPHKVEILTETSYYTMRRIYDKDIGDLLMVFVHLPSKLHAGDDERKEILREVKFEVEQLEGKLKIDKTLVVGDFNANPFEDSMVLANSLHALPIGEIVKRKEGRTVNGKAYSMFYNPMWNLMGDFKEPSGTYYYPKGGLRTDYWNIFDQVVLRPTLIDKLNKNTINIIHEINDESLIRDGKPIDTISDHLPIFFELGGWDNE